MSQKMSVILLCGGQGTRMQSSTPKQFLPLKNKLIAHYSLDVFKTIHEVEEIIIVCDPAYRHLFSINLDSIPIHFALPGIRRQDSVFNGFKALTKNSAFVCVHDSARPFINESMVRRIFAAACEHGAATAGMPLKFTLKEHDGSLFVKDTPDRSKYWEIQTPQIVRTETLKQGFEYIVKNNLDVTDDVSIAEKMGCPVKLIEACYSNIKITTPDDLILGELLLNKSSQ